MKGQFGPHGSKFRTCSPHVYADSRCVLHDSHDKEMEVISMQNSSNPNSAGPSRPPKRFLKKGLLTFGTRMALADKVFAQSTTSPWTQTVHAMQTDFTDTL